jgi:hypothetical protein
MATTQYYEEHQHPFRVRPRFEIETHAAVDEVVNKIKTSLEESDSIVQARIRNGYATLFLPLEEQHFWSPELTINVEKTESEDGSIISGLYGPRPAVWTAFVFIYSLLGFAILVTSIIGFANKSIGNSSSILWLVPILILILIGFYLSSYFGQKLAHDQMLTLHDFVEKNIRDLCKTRN